MLKGEYYLNAVFYLQCDYRPMLMCPGREEECLNVLAHLRKGPPEAPEIQVCQTYPIISPNT